MIKGKWKGFYKHSSSAIPEEKRNIPIYFEIEIDEQIHDQFKGTVTDDVSTGGMEGRGEIIGELTGDIIRFIKKMPIETILMPNGKLKTTKRKHRHIVYTGELSEDRDTYKGEWKIKFGIAWLGIIPVPVGTNKGIWEMKKEN